jgi:endonuclease/exonuclease/phosphatase family metal-dependent hydrolase
LALLFTFLGIEAQAMVLMTQNLRCLPEKKSEENVLALPQRLSKLIEIIRRNKVDILMLQEVCSNQQLSALEMFLEQSQAADIKWNFILKTFAHDSYGKWREELVILSKVFPISAREFKLPDPVLGRVLQALYLPQYEMWVANTHLSHADDQGIQRKKQMQTIVDYFGDAPVMLLGDFNSGPHDVESYVFKNARYRPYFHGASWPAWQPKHWYDGLWKSPTTTHRIQSSQMVDIGSDHLGVIYWLDAK